MFENLIFFNKKKIDQYAAYMLGKKVEGNTQANYLCRNKSGVSYVFHAWFYTHL